MIEYFSKIFYKLLPKIELKESRLLKILKNSLVLDSLDTNEFIYASVCVNDNIINVSVNKDLPPSVHEDLLSTINNFNTEEVVLICRGPHEPFTKQFPKNNTLLFLRKSNKNIKLFFQNPWPSEIPKFNKNLSTLRFGFDENSQLDKIKKDSIFSKRNIYDKKVNVIINKNKIIFLENKKSII